jgi:hypothetical protein
MITTVDAIRSLTPGASYAIIDDEIVWSSPDITQPTQAEIDAEIARLQVEQEAEVVQKAADKASGNAKLKALGLTDAEIEAIT